MMKALYGINRILERIRRKIEKIKQKTEKMENDNYYRQVMHEWAEQERDRKKKRREKVKQRGVCLAQMIDSGMSVREIAGHQHCSGPRIYWLLKKYNITSSTKRHI
jgi:DNA invertase Pin-like site-specific DNA recombinase